MIYELNWKPREFNEWQTTTYGLRKYRVEHFLIFFENEIFTSGYRDVSLNIFVIYRSRMVTAEQTTFRD